MAFPDHDDLDELRRQAVLAAMGMLDERELAQYERAFDELPLSTQEEFRRLQAECVTDGAFLGTEPPTHSLRSRTLARMITDVEQQTATSLAPIAQIGAPRRTHASSRTPVRSIDAAELMEQAMATANARADADRFARSAYWWRAAAIGLIAALVVAIYFERQASWTGLRVGELAMHRMAREDILQLLKHPGLRELSEQADVVRGMRVVGADGVGSGTLMLDSRTGNAMLLTIGLRPGETYTLWVTRQDGRREAVGTIAPPESMGAAVLSAATETPALAVALATGLVELVDSRGEVVLST